MKKYFTTTTISKIAILSALAIIIGRYSFPIPFIPPFYRLDFSEVIVFVSGFALGPVSVIVIELIKNILLTLLMGSSTAYVGEFANFVLGVAFCLPAAIVYKKDKTKKSAIKGIIISGISLCVFGMIVNYIVLLPAYSFFYNIPMDALINEGTKIFPIIKDRFTFVLFATLPFNLIKSIIIGFCTVIIYKHVSVLLKR